MELYKVQVDQNNGQGWVYLQYSPRTLQEAEELLSRFQSRFPNNQYQVVPHTN